MSKLKSISVIVVTKNLTTIFVDMFSDLNFKLSEKRLWSNV